MEVELITPRPLFDTKAEAREILSQLLEVEKDAWGGSTDELNASEAKIRRRVESFPEGVTLATLKPCGPHQRCRSVGSQFAFRFDWDGDASRLSSWDEGTASGWTDKIHRSGGNTGFLVGVGVRPEFRHMSFWHSRRHRWNEPMRASMLLIAETLDKLFMLGVQQVIGNARVPHYHLRSELPVDAYCDLRRPDGLLFDPVLRFHERMGAKILKPVAYSMNDPESCDAGCWVVYRQPFEG